MFLIFACGTNRFSHEEAHFITLVLVFQCVVKRPCVSKMIIFFAFMIQHFVVTEFEFGNKTYQFCINHAVDTH